MNFADLFSSFPPRRALAGVMIVSIALYALAANLVWARHELPVRRLRRQMETAESNPAGRVLGELARWVYYLGLPYVALILGYTSIRALGIWATSWLEPLVWATALGVGTVIVFLWVWRPFARMEHVYAVDQPQWSWARRVIEAIYQQAHWAFYRSGPILWLGDFYWGSFVGLFLTLIEGWTNPSVRSSIRDIHRADAPLWTGSIAVVTTIIFIFSENVWYCLATHLILDLVLRNYIGFPKHSEREEMLPFESNN